VAKPSDVLIVGQGLAGTLLGWALERAGISFTMAELSPPNSVSAIAAGILNPITGRRLVKSWRAETLIPLARETYCTLGEAIGSSLWRDLRIRRLFEPHVDRERFEAKRLDGTLEPFADEGDAEGFWIQPAGHVNLPMLLATSVAWWRRTGRLREGPVQLAAELDHYGVVIDCRGIAGTDDPLWQFVPWEHSKGELLEIEVEGLEPNVVLNRGHWVLPTQNGRALVGATNEPGRRDGDPTEQARMALEASARAIIGRPFNVRSHAAGIRVNLPDKLPVVGRHPQQPRVGLVNALGAKGAMLAPFLAQQWVNHLASGAPFDPEIELGRFLS
jgi:glycine/D-amino acid oxidase-like deaminating enzyme